GVAVPARKFATPVRIDGVGEGQFSFRVDFAQNGTRGQRAIFGEAAGRAERCVGGGAGQGRDLFGIEDGEEGSNIRHLFAFWESTPPFSRRQWRCFSRLWIFDLCLIG